MPEATAVAGTEAQQQVSAGSTGSAEPSLSADGAAVASIIAKANADPAYAAQPEVKALLEKVKALTPVSAPVIQPTNPSDALSTEGQQVAQILEMAKADPEFAKQPQVAALVEKARLLAEEKLKQANISAEEESDQATPDDETDIDEEAADKKSKSVFFGKKTKAPVLSTPDEHAKYIEAKFGVKDPVQLYQAAEGWRNDSQALKAASDENAGYKKLVDEMPDVIYEALQEWGKGGDWASKLKIGIPVFNFSKSFADQKEAVVNHFFPGKFTTQEINDSADTIAQNAVDVAKAKFDMEKTGLENKRALTLEEAERKANSRKASVDSSVNVLKESFPDFNPRHLSDVTKMLLSGDVNKVFFKSDGTLKPEAAKMLALALYGEQEITGRVNSAKRKAGVKATNEVLMNVLDRSNTTVKSAPGAENREVVPSELMKTLSSLNKKSTY